MNVRNRGPLLAGPKHSRVPRDVIDSFIPSQLIVYKYATLDLLDQLQVEQFVSLSRDGYAKERVQVKSSQTTIELK